jgi:hypothetical protein
MRAAAGEVQDAFRGSQTTARSCRRRSTSTRRGSNAKTVAAAAAVARVSRSGRRSLPRISSCEPSGREALAVRAGCSTRHCRRTAAADRSPALPARGGRGARDFAPAFRRQRRSPRRPPFQPSKAAERGGVHVGRAFCLAPHPQPFGRRVTRGALPVNLRSIRALLQRASPLADDALAIDFKQNVGGGPGRGRHPRRKLSKPDANRSLANDAGWSRCLSEQATGHGG